MNREFLYILILELILKHAFNKWLFSLSKSLQALEIRNISNFVKHVKFLKTAKNSMQKLKNMVSLNAYFIFSSLSIEQYSESKLIEL